MSTVGLVVDGGHHLARHEAVPDQLVELVLLFLEVLLDGVGVDVDAGRADGLVGVLRALLGLEDVVLRRDELLAVDLLDLGADLGDGVVADARRVRTHVGDEADRAAVALEVDALVEALGDLHGPLGAEVQVAGGVLLELGGGVGRGRVALLLLADDLLHLVGGAGEIGAHGGRLRGVGDLDLGAVGGGELHGEALPRDRLQGGADVPVLDGLEGLDLALAVDDQAERHGLHAPGREAEGELGPDQGRDVVADDAVEDPAGPLRVVELLVELAGVAHPVVDALLGDLVELHALDLELRALDLLGDVERDGLALAIGVGREQDLVHLLGGGLELFEDLLLALDDPVRLGEVVRDVDRRHLLALDLRLLLGGQILDVPLGREHFVPGAQVFLDGLRLGRRLHDHERLGHHHLLTATERASRDRAMCLLEPDHKPHPG